jgi:hypothetical protein
VQKNESKLTVLFEDPFWIGVAERVSKGELSVCKIIFGSEPKDFEVYDFILKDWHKLRFSTSVKIKEKQEVRINPKRMQREISKQLDVCGIGTKSQQALKLQQEEGKAARKGRSRQQKNEEKQMKYELHKHRNKEKHRGH